MTMHRTQLGHLVLVTLDSQEKGLTTKKIGMKRFFPPTWGKESPHPSGSSASKNQSFLENPFLINYSPFQLHTKKEFTVGQRPLTV